MRRTQKQLQEEESKYKVLIKDKRYYGYRICCNCKNEIEHSSVKRFILLRTIRNLDNKKLFCSSCNKKGELNHFYGKNHTKKSINKISKNRTGKACGEKNSMSKKEHRDNVSIALIKKYKSGELDFLKDIQRANAFKNQANGKLKTAPISSAEKEIKKILEDKGYEVISQFNIGSLKYDLLIKNKNMLIEYNGDYWHCNPIIYAPDYFHKKKQLLAEEIWKHDFKKRKIAEEKGYKLFIIWERDYMFNKENEINKIITNLE